MTPNANLSDRLALLTRLAPQSISTSATSAYVGPSVLGNFTRLLAIAQTGENGAGNVTATLLKASDNSGSGATPMLTAAVLAAAAGDNQDILFNLAIADLDPAKPYLALKLAVSADACLVSALLLGSDARYDPASDNNAASVAQIL